MKNMQVKTEIQEVRAGELCKQASEKIAEDNYQDAINMYLIALENYKSLAGENKERYTPIVADTLCELSMALWMAESERLSEKYAIEAVELYMELERRNQGEYIHRVVDALENQSIALMMRHKLRGKTTVDEKILAIYRLLENQAHDKYTRQIIEKLDQLGYAHRRLKQYMLAETEYMEMINRIRHAADNVLDNPQFTLAMAYQDWAMLYVDMEHYDDANRNYQLAISILNNLIGYERVGYHHTMAELLDRYAHCCAKQGMIEKALELIDEAISSDPQYADLYDSKGQFLLMRGDRGGAVEMWNKVIKIEPAHRDYYYSDLYDKLFLSLDKYNDPRSLKEELDRLIKELVHCAPLKNDEEAKQLSNKGIGLAHRLRYYSPCDAYKAEVRIREWMLNMCTKEGPEKLELWDMLVNVGRRYSGTARSVFQPNEWKLGELLLGRGRSEQICGKYDIAQRDFEEALNIFLNHERELSMEDINDYDFDTQQYRVLNAFCYGPGILQSDCALDELAWNHIYMGHQNEAIRIVDSLIQKHPENVIFWEETKELMLHASENLQNIEQLRNQEKLRVSWNIIQ